LPWALGSESKARLEAMLTLAGTVLPIADNGKGWDETPGLLGCENGVIDLKRNEFRDGRPEDRITKTTGLDDDPSTAAPRWRAFVSEVLEDAEVVAFMKRLVGYGLTAEASLDLLVFLMGVGRNGKSTFIETLDAACGDYATSVSPRAFLDARKVSHSTEKRDLAGARFAYTEELGDDVLDMNSLKAYSGGGKHRARGVRENTVEFKQTWLLFFTTNGLPHLNDNSWGAWSRIVSFDFPRIFTGKEEPTLEETLRGELPGILAWAVEGAVEWYATGIGDLPAAVVEKTAQYRDELDPLAPLIADGYLEKCEETIWTPTVNLAEGYKAYANSKGWPMEKRWSETFLGTHLAAQFTKKRRTVTLADGSQKKMIGYLGVRCGPASGIEGGSWDLSGSGAVDAGLRDSRDPQKGEG
jgi:putative DNA primase/helicase